MNNQEFKEIIEKELLKIDIKISQKQVDMLYTYMNKILEWNEKINLTAITNKNEFIIKHFVDSLTVNKYVQNAKKVIDIGTGAGFPGIPIKIMNPEIKVTLIDSVNKKLNVIRDINNELELSNLEIIHTRAEDLAKNENYKENFDIAITRAVSKMDNIVKYMLPFVKKNGYAICMKGPNYKNELDDSKKTIERYGGKVEKIESINIDNEINRNIILIKKWYFYKNK